MRLNTVEFLSFGEDRIFAKEQALIDLVRSELEQNRPCVIYIRQTATRDIQPRIAHLITEHVPGAKPFILKNTVQADRREKVIDAEVAKGCNVIICNPELTKTGLDLVFAATIIFAELVFNLSTLMQAAALVDPAALFRTSAEQSTIEAEDAAFWNVEITDESEPEPLQHDPLIRWAVEHLGAQPGLPMQRTLDGRQEATPAIITLPAQRTDKPSAPPRKLQPRRRRQRDLLAVPEDVPAEPKVLPLTPKQQPDEPQPVQLAMF